MKQEDPTRRVILELFHDSSGWKLNQTKIGEAMDVN